MCTALEGNTYTIQSFRPNSYQQQRHRKCLVYCRMLHKVHFFSCFSKPDIILNTRKAKENLAVPSYNSATISMLSLC